MITDLIIHKLSYAGMAFLLGGAGMISPVPEELTLLTAGYLSAIGVMILTRAIPIAILALLAGDSVLFALAKFGAPYAHKIHARLVESGLHATWIFDPERPLRAVFLLRFVTGIRLITPIFAGVNDASWVGFLATDLAALSIFVPLMTFLGFYFHANFLEFVATFEIVRHMVFGVIVAFVGGSVLIAISPTLHRWYERVKSKSHE